MPLPRFQFRLRTLLIVVALLAVPCAYLGWQYKIVRQRQAIVGRLKGSALFVGAASIGDTVLTAPEPEIPWLRRMMGDHGIGKILMTPAHADERDEIQAAFPEARLEILGEAN